MGTLTKADIIQSIRDACSEIVCISDELDNLRRQLGELGMALRDWDEVRQPSDRREQSFQGPLDQEIQSAEEELKELPKTYNPDWYSNTTGYGRSVGTGGYLGPRHEVRNQPYTIPRYLPAAGPNKPTHKSCVLLETKTRS